MSFEGEASCEEGFYLAVFLAKGKVLRCVAGANIPISFQLEEGDKK